MRLLPTIFMSTSIIMEGLFHNNQNNFQRKSQVQNLCASISYKFLMTQFGLIHHNRKKTCGNYQFLYFT